MPGAGHGKHSPIVSACYCGCGFVGVIPKEYEGFAKILNLLQEWRGILGKHKKINAKR